MLLLLIFVEIVLGLDLPEDRFEGCYRARGSIGANEHIVYDNKSPSDCLAICKESFYRFSMVKNNNVCMCDNRLGEQVNTTLHCKEFTGQEQNYGDVGDVYGTGSLIPGPPQNVALTNLTDVSVYISWQQPKSFIDITSYRINAVVLHSYDTFIPNSPEWSYSNDTFSTKIILYPATKYNISLTAEALGGLGASFYKVIETELGEPAVSLDPPKVIKNNGDKIEIQITETLNRHGPITSYLVIVLDESQIFQQDHSLQTYDEAKKEGTGYYVAAELKPDQVASNFMVGNGRYYGKYYNAPLDKNLKYKIIIGVVSTLNGKSKRAFSSSYDLIEEDVPIPEENDGDSSVLIIGLSIAIGLFSLMLVAGIIGFLILRNRVTNRRQRLSDNQELTLQGPMIEVENNGYIHEEEDNIKVNHYRHLKQKLKIIPYSQLKIEPTNLLGSGRFGRVNTGSIYGDNGDLIPVAAYSISDKKLSNDSRKIMLQELDILIKAGKHRHIIELLGTCETAQMIVVVLEYVSMNFKDLLINSRITDGSGESFSNLTELQVLDIAVNVSRGMEQLQRNKVMHRQLCARNILIANGFIPKITGFGLSHYYSHNNIPDYTRWTALELFKEIPPPASSKSDVWSFGCLLWESCTIGGTPYAQIPSDQVFQNIKSGIRLPQTKYFSDEFYQFLLDCWQIDGDERPNFGALTESLEAFTQNTFSPSLSFSMYPNFQFEPFLSNEETAARPVF